MWHAREIREMHTRLLWNERKEDSLVDEGLDGIIKK
jgi:hypothetical protein